MAPCLFFQTFVMCANKVILFVISFFVCSLTGCDDHAWVNVTIRNTPNAGTDNNVTVSTTGEDGLTCGHAAGGGVQQRKVYQFYLKSNDGTCLGGANAQFGMINKLKVRVHLARLTPQDANNHKVTINDFELCCLKDPRQGPYSKQDTFKGIGWGWGDSCSSDQGDGKRNCVTLDHAFDCGFTCFPDHWSVEILPITVDEE